MGHRSFRDQLTFSIGFALGRSRDLLRRILHGKSPMMRAWHVTDDAREMLAKRVLEHLELSGFVIDEEQQLMTRRFTPHGHG
jgi:hypothetical protein